MYRFTAAFLLLHHLGQVYVLSLVTDASSIVPVRRCKPFTTIPFMFSFQELSDEQLELAVLKRVFNDEDYEVAEIYSSFRVVLQKEKKVTSLIHVGITGYI